MSPIGKNPAPEFHVEVAVTSMFAPRANFPDKAFFMPCKVVEVASPATPKSVITV